MRETIERMIKEYVADYPASHSIQTRWREPIIAFADARDPRILALKKVVHPEHFLPDDILRGARTIVSYFLPFDERIEKSNVGGVESSREWDYAYVETNTLFNDLNRDVTIALNKLGFRSAFVPPSVIYDRESEKGRWSHRHLAVIAGLGTFGLNNLLITEKGCCGRANSFLINCETEPMPSITEEYCLYKRDGSCALCAVRCVGDALSEDGFDRFKCGERLKKNSTAYPDIGILETCGKCAVGLPCSLAIPR